MTAHSTLSAAPPRWKRRWPNAPFLIVSAALSNNLHERVRALFFFYATHHFHIPLNTPPGSRALIPFAGYRNLMKRRFEEALEIFLAAQAANGPSAPISSAA